MLVAHTAFAATGRNPTLSGLGEVGEDAPFGVFHDRPARDVDDQVVGRTSGTALRTAGLSIFRLVDAGVAHVEQGRVLFVHLQDHMTAATAVTAIGTAEGYELFAVETANAIAALTGANFN